MTNGEKIQQMFPGKCPHIGFNEYFGRIWLMQDGEDFANFTMNWWNSEYKEPTTENDLPHCQHTDEEIAKSFIEDVEAVKDQLPCGEQMDFPNTFDEFAKDYGFKDKKEIYTNGSELIPVFRVKQWLEHISTTKNDLEVQKAIEIIKADNLTSYSVDEILSARDLAVEALKQMTTAKNLGVDCIDRAEVLKLMQDNWHTHNGDWAMQESMDDIRALPSVTPQEPRKGCLSIDDVMAVFDDFMCGEVDEDGTETFLEMLKDKADMREVTE